MLNKFCSSSGICLAPSHHISLSPQLSSRSFELKLKGSRVGFLHGFLAEDENLGSLYMYIIYINKIMLTSFNFKELLNGGCIPVAIQSFR